MLSSAARRLARRGPQQWAARSAGFRQMHELNGEPMFDKILIANRGEIARRVIRTAKKMGVKTVAVYSEPDAMAPHVREADEAVCIGPAASADSYLQIDRIVQVCKDTGAEAVHPGYGFLSENHLFQEALQAAGVKFIGPNTRAITVMGDKIASKKLAEEAGVNVVPGFTGEVHTDEEVTRISNEIGYPVMIKASAGGGGKGMRIAWNDGEAIEGFRLSKEEAKSSFGDDRIFIEKYIEEPRHIEIQLVADSHGNVACLPERECSVQRRNQKVVEESPSVLLDDETRAAMQSQAAQLARAVDYENAATVEFLCDKHKNFYFLEMNTRLQVEHPVSEMISGVDLVEQMLRVAAGSALPDEMVAGLPIRGWSIESRVYAEDPFRNFLPSIGRLTAYEEPVVTDADTPDVRVDAGVTQGSEISMFYDPMICKLVTHGPTRDSALASMRRALDAYVIGGVNHNVPFLRDLIDHERFCSGAITTNLIPEEYPDGFTGVSLPPSEGARLAATALAMQLSHKRKLSGNAAAAAADMWEEDEQEAYSQHVVTITGNPDGERTFYVSMLSCTPSDEAEGADDADYEDFESYGLGTNHIEPLPTVPAQAYGSGPYYPAVPLNRGPLSAGARDMVLLVSEVGEDGSSSHDTLLRLNGVDWATGDKLFQAAVESDLDDGEEFDNEGDLAPSEEEVVVQCLSHHADGRLGLQYRGALRTATVMSPREAELNGYMLPKPEMDFSKVVVSPMPGKLVSLAVSAGDHVEVGQEVAVVEAMKMQNVLRAPRSGRVASLGAAPGDTLAVDEVIVEFEDEE